MAKCWYCAGEGELVSGKQCPECKGTGKDQGC